MRKQTQRSWDVPMNYQPGPSHGAWREKIQNGDLDWRHSILEQGLLGKKTGFLTREGEGALSTRILSRGSWGPCDGKERPMRVEGGKRWGKDREERGNRLGVCFLWRRLLFLCTLRWRHIMCGVGLLGARVELCAHQMGTSDIRPSHNLVLGIMFALGAVSPQFIF